MLPALKKPSETFKFYEFRASEELANAPSSEGRSRVPHKYSYQHTPA